MPQYLADIKEKEFFIENEEAHHLTVVARRNEGDEIVVFDGKGKQFKARIDRAKKVRTRYPSFSYRNQKICSLCRTLFCPYFAQYIRGCLR